jgi:exonuclease SbcC
VEHPFVKNYCDSGSQTENLLAEKNREQQELKQREKDLVARVSKAQSDVDSTKQQLAQLSEKMDSYTKLIVQTITDWSWHDDTDLSQRLQEEKDQLKDQLLAKENAVKLLEQLQKAASRNKDFMHLKEQIDAVVADNIKFFSLVNDYGIGLNGCSLKEAITMLEQHFKAYDTKVKQFQQSENQSLKNNVSRKEKGAQLTESMRRYANLDKELEAVKKLLGDKQKERHELFGEQQADVAEAEIKQQTETATIAHNKLEISINENSTLCKALDERQQVLQEHIQKDQKRLLTDSEGLLTKLNALGIPSIEAALEALLESLIVAELEAEQRDLDNEKAKLEHYYSGHSKKLSELKDKVAEIDESADEIVVKLKMQEAGLEELLSRRGGSSERIKSDVNNKARHQEKAQAIKVQKQEVNRWAQLSDLIGDATGNKFARFAQELTLRQVLLLANRHLKRLSDRYVIKHVKAENLDELFVVDTYHGNAERSVKTLSGGESFLVSLSLALGLSDLAGQNTVIGSLFIDEGFGTLDQSTLDVALSALEKLQSETSRTIGIISHVPALKERVTTQIELKKNATGYSTLEIRR